MEQQSTEADEIIEREIRAVLAEIDGHVSAVEVLLTPFHDHTGNHDDGGAGLAHLEILSSVFDDIVTGNLQPGWADNPIWSEKERDTWSPFATEVSDHLYATWPLVVKLVELRQRTTSPHGFASIVALKWRIEAAGEQTPPLSHWASLPAGDLRAQDELAYRERQQALHFGPRGQA